MKTYQQNLNVIKNAANNALSGNAAERQTLNPNTAAMREGGTLVATETRHRKQVVFNEASGVKCF